MAVRFLRPQRLAIDRERCSNRQNLEQAMSDFNQSISNCRYGLMYKMAAIDRLPIHKLLTPTLPGIFRHRFHHVGPQMKCCKLNRCCCFCSRRSPCSQRSQVCSAHSARPGLVADLKLGLLLLVERPDVSGCQSIQSATSWLGGLEAARSPASPLGSD